MIEKWKRNCKAGLHKGGYDNPVADATGWKKKQPGIEEQLHQIVEPEIGGEPQSQRKWTRRSQRWMSRQLKRQGYSASAPTVGRLLRLMELGYRSNQKQVEGRQSPERDSQFRKIAELREAFEQAQLPIVSVDTKDKCLLGNFATPGREWCRQARRVNMHDFPSDAQARAVPYGIYDVQRNCGTVFVGDSADTAEFAVRALQRWWLKQGQQAYPGATKLLVLADSGGSNGCRCRLWKQQIQERMCNALGLQVTVLHYPTGCSKWNPIEHRLFSQISANWAAQPLLDFPTLLSAVRGTTTTTGLKVSAYRLKGNFAIGRKVPNSVMKDINVLYHSICPQWSYTILPQTTTT